MIKRLVAIAAIVSLPFLGLVGCQTDKLLPKSPYFGVDHSGKHFVPEEIQEKREAR